MKITEHLKKLMEFGKASVWAGIMAIILSLFMKSIQIYLVFITNLVLFVALLVILKKVKNFSTSLERVEDIIDVSDKIKKGDFNVDISYNSVVNDEYNKIIMNLLLIKDNNKRILIDVENALLLISKGVYETRLNRDNYEGDYKEFIDIINKSFDERQKLYEEINKK